MFSSQQFEIIPALCGSTGLGYFENVYSCVDCGARVTSRHYDDPADTEDGRETHTCM